jgi:hypothetical protein
MPSSTSQANLIRQTYARAGLSVDEDRCQYFEAHGTGTQAGDPQEAGAIHQAFFSNKAIKDPNDVLYVGSIKTVIGHTEGTAGLAGLLKASLSIQHGIIPPNMLFENLNPAVEPYYGSLEILTSARPWPELPAGVPRRASVNSFGKFPSCYSRTRRKVYICESSLLTRLEQVSEEQTPMPSLKAMIPLFGKSVTAGGNCSCSHKAPWLQFPFYFPAARRRRWPRRSRHTCHSFPKSTKERGPISATSPGPYLAGLHSP